MLRSIQKLIGDKRKQLIFPIFLMSLDAIGSLVMYLISHILYHQRPVTVSMRSSRNWDISRIAAHKVLPLVRPKRFFFWQKCSMEWDLIIRICLKSWQVWRMRFLKKAMVSLYSTARPLSFCSILMNCCKVPMWTA